MESLRIYQDQENARPLGELRQKQSNLMAASQQQKRPILATIDPNCNKQQIGKGKSALLKDKTYHSCTVTANNRNNNNEPSTSRNNHKTIVPIVPVAQFEAFKVYEDDDVKMDSQDKLKKDQNDDDKINPFLIENVTDIPNLLKENVPMSIEKLNEDNQIEKDNRLPMKPEDLFFEMKEYGDEIFAYLRRREIEHRPKPGYILKQPDVTENMRSILVDWLVEVAEEYQLSTETLYLAVNFIDRFLSYMSVVRAKLQLVGTACMFIASKYEEICPPDVKEFVYITDDTYDKSQVIRMEALILRVLGFDLSIPTPFAFITLISTFVKMPKKMQYLALYLSELTILEVERYLQLLPSTIAAAAICVARHTLGEEPWTEDLKRATGYNLSTLKYAATFITDMFTQAPTYPQHAIQDKYKKDEFLNVSKLRPNSKAINFD